MIEVEHFSYSYGSQLAVDDISFALNDGEIVALIGPNGAGKSTTMKVLTTLLRPCAGRISIAGYDVVEQSVLARQHLGYLPETNPLYADMIVYDALKSVSLQRMIPKQKLSEAITAAAQQCGLESVMHQTIATLSRGYRQRVGIAQAIIHNPSVLILDEATSGLDPNQIREIRDLIIQIGKKKTVLISTHILQEVTAIANRIILMNHGKIVCDGQIAELLADLSQKRQIDHPDIEDLFSYYTTGENQ